jgi:hypothetical protein
LLSPLSVRKLKRGGNKLDDLSGHTKPLPGLPWAIYNGAWACHVAGKAWLEEPFMRLLARAVELEPASFAVIPDIVAGGADSLAFSLDWWSRHRNGLAADASPSWLLAVQDGMTVLEVRRALERHRLGGIFVGGSAGPGTPMWKWRTVHDWAELGLELGVRVHVGRVNGERRAALCHDLGVTSIDGSAVSRFAVNGTKMGRSCDGTEPVHPPPGPGRVGLPEALEREIAELEPVARHTIAKRRFQLALDAIDP